MQTFKDHLNPIYKDIDEISKYDDLKDLSELEQQEYPNLQKVVQMKVQELKDLLPRLDKLEEELEHQILLIESEASADERMSAKKVYNQILAQIRELVQRINSELLILDSPYFGKIVFEPEDTGRDIQIYIGKGALIDKETQIPLITDWRSPISNIYYENTGPKDNVSFQAPVGERFGDLKQKRQFQISRGRINGIYDAKSGNVAADEFLLTQLNERLGKKLQDIVSTIQKLQNTIIRDDINKPIVMQGVAGSGKTTILLHRLAYLFYTYKEEIRAYNSLIIAPNQVFIDYVSDVLPSLGVERVETLTYLFWGKHVLDWDDSYTVSSEDEDLDIKEYKGSREFIDVLDEYFEYFEEQLLDNIPYSRKDIIRKRYYDLKDEFKDIEMLERLDLATDYAFAKKQFKEGRTGFYDNTYDNDASKRKSIYEYFRRNCNVYTLYKNLFKSDFVTSDTAKYTLKGLAQSGRDRKFRMEDLGPLVYLQLKIVGSKNFSKDCVVVDEAQDMSFVQLATLLKIAKNSNMTMAGDLAQSIIPPFYIKDWDDVIKLVKDQSGMDTTYYQLQRCYRTTVEIVEFANDIFKDWFPKSYRLPEAVLRHGDEVKVLEYNYNILDMENDDLGSLVKIMRDQFEKGSVTCALLCRDRNHAKKMYCLFKEYEDLIGRQVISYEESDYNTGLLVLPIENAKGLEFDTVIFADLNSTYYGTSELDIKLLYVGITRALHRVYIVTKSDDSVSRALL